MRHVATDQSTSQKYIEALPDQALIDLYWQMQDTRHLLPRRLRGAADKSPSAVRTRHRRANAQHRIRALALRRGLNLQSGEVYRRLFQTPEPPAPRRPRKGDRVRSKHHAREGKLIEIEWSPRLGENMYLVLFPGDRIATACPLEDLTVLEDAPAD